MPIKGYKKLQLYNITIKKLQLKYCNFKKVPIKLLQLK